MRVHDLKLWKDYFGPVASGEKTFEFRLNDRGYQKGDRLILREFDNNKRGMDCHKMTGRVLSAVITYVMGGKGVFPRAHDLADWVILGIKLEPIPEDCEDEL